MEFVPVFEVQSRSGKYLVVNTENGSVCDVVSAADYGNGQIYAQAICDYRNDERYCWYLDGPNAASDAAVAHLNQRGALRTEYELSVGQSTETFPNTVSGASDAFEAYRSRVRIQTSVKRLAPEFTEKPISLRLVVVVELFSGTDRRLLRDVEVPVLGRQSR
jgi:hypothetical protein